MEEEEVGTQGGGGGNSGGVDGDVTDLSLIEVRATRTADKIQNERSVLSSAWNPQRIPASRTRK